MAFEDALFSHVIWKVIFPSFSICSALLYLLYHAESLKFKFNSWVLPRFCTHELLLPVGLKWQIFGQRLQRLKSSDWQLKNKGLIRILEIGVGEGRNFDYYPKNSRLMFLEPNPYTRVKLFQNLQNYPHFKLEQYLEGYAEDMTAITDSSIDAVVTNGVLCSVLDVYAALEEIYRVLAPGGEFLYTEHCIGSSENVAERVVRCALSPLWRILFSCDIRRDILGEIHAAKFKETAHYTYTNNKYEGVITEVILSPIVIGYAVK